MIFVHESNLYLRVLYFLLMALCTWITFLLYVNDHIYINSMLALSTIFLIGEGRLMLKGLIAALTKKFHWKWLSYSLYAPESKS